MAARQRLGFFTRVLDEVGPAERYRLALEQIRTAEDVGFDTAWVAQHHFHGQEGGLPSPFVLLSYAAAQTSRIVLGTSIVTLPLEAPVRVAEDAAVLALLSDGRFELGIGSGGTPSSFPPSGTILRIGREISRGTFSNCCPRFGATSSRPTTVRSIPPRPV